MIWLALAACTAIALILLLAPLVWPPANTPTRADYDIKVFRDQLHELERDKARGLIADQDATAARIEIERKILAADANQGGGGSDSADRPAAIAAAIVLGVAAPALAFGMYAYLGSPALPDQPLASRAGDMRTAGQQEFDLRAGVEQMGLRIQQDPSDLAAWLELGGMLMALGRTDDAVEAFSWAVRVSGDDPAVRSLYGEALVRASSGVVTEEAHATFAAVVGDAPLETRARYYLALADYQAGKLERALAAWQSLATEATPDAPWRAVVVARIREVAGELDRDPVALVPDARIPDARGPDDGDLAAAQEMTPDQQQAMIRSMVDGLAARLQDSPHDVEGWLRLARSYTVLGEPDRAIDAYANANEQAPDRLDILESYAKAALAPIDEGAPLPPRVIDIMRDIEALAPDHPDALWFLGVAAAQDGRADDAIASWERLLEVMPADGDRRELVAREIQALKQN